MRNFLILLIFLVVIGCSSSTVPKGVLEPDKMQKVIYDMIRIDEYLTSFASRDSTIDLKKKRSLLYEQAFRIHNTNKKEFYSSFKYYEQHPDIQKGLYDSLYSRLNRVTLMADTTKVKGKL